MSQAPRYWQQTPEGKAKIAAHQKALAAAGKHWTQTPEGRKHMAAIASKGARWTKTKAGRARIGKTSQHWSRTPEGRQRMSTIATLRNKAMAKKPPQHWTQTPEGRKRMSKIATLGRAILKKKIASGEGALKRAQNGARGTVPWGAHRVDVPETTRVLIARRYRAGVKGSDLGREYGVSTTTVRDWAKRYGAGAQRNGVHPSNRAQTLTTHACGACRVCLVFEMFGAEPQWIMCLVARPVKDGGVV